MNQRIKELAIEAGYFEDCFGIGHWDMPECKKFAQLLIDECIEVALNAKSKEAAAMIVMHFGVKE